MTARFQSQALRRWAADALLSLRCSTAPGIVWAVAWAELVVTLRVGALACGWGLPRPAAAA